ncbi:flagellin [Zooshikella ganghwensis]|uniref:flagellin N-terminal helical domain-containing protein n=1 Tax=Zooshikella ganghwensis TaxID=202772 RepID=UPI00040DC5FE|nr:flagellin [Zooshikella ganghwensis]
MPQIINTNLLSLIAQRNLNQTQQAQATALERLSSGLRINNASDDAAGLAISIRFGTQISSTATAIRNANDGISLTQTAEGALSSITTNLQRIRELALQSSNGSNTSLDRDSLNEEVQQLIDEIQDVANNTTFNGKPLLNGSLSKTNFQVGTNLGETIPVSISAITPDRLGSALTDGISSTRPGSLTSLLAGDIVINSIAVPAPSSTNDSLSSADNEKSGIAIAAAINSVSDQTGVNARANTNVVGYAGFLAATNATVSGNIIINGTTIAVATNNALSADTNRESVVTAINAAQGQTGVRAENTGSINTGITLIADDGRNIVYDDNGSGLSAAVAVGISGAAQTFVGSYTLISRSGADINIDFGRSDIDRFTGLLKGTFSGGNSGVVGRRVGVTQALQSGDLVINGVAVGPSLTSDDTASFNNKDGSAIAKAGAINRVSGQTGVTATALPTIAYGTAITTGNTRNESIDINGETINISFNAADSASTIINNVLTAVNSKQGVTGVTAEAFGTSFRLVAADGRNINLANDSANVAEAGFNVASIGADTGSSILLTGAGQIDITTQNPFSAIDRSGFRVGEFGNVEDGKLLDNVDITTASNATDALTSIDNALDQVSSLQASLGALQNRFQSSVNNLSVFSENLSAANSRIVDADFAAETAAFSRAQVLQEAGISVLVQANANAQQVLALLDF